MLVRRSRNGWSLSLGALALAMMAVGVLATIDAWSDILLRARKDEEASHIFLVPLVVAWLVWVRRSRLARCTFRPSSIGAILVGLGWVVTSVGFRYSVQSMWHLGAVMVVVGCLLSVLGKDLLVRFLPAFLVLVFLVPIPGRVRQRVSVPLMNATAIVTKDVSDLLGVPVERQGNQITVNNEPITIVEACNGLRMVFALVLVCYAFAFGEPLRNYVRLIIIAATPLSAIACNVARLVPTAWAYGYAGKEIGDAFHNWSPWVMLIVAFLLLMGIIRVLRWALIPVTRYTLAWGY
jgi:exosortase